MGFSRYYFQKQNFMLTKITDEINDDDLYHHVVALNKEVEGIANLKELADCREIIKINLTTAGTTRSADHEQIKKGSKLAILTPKGNDLIFAMARAYQMFCEDYRESVSLFHDLDEALAWLTNDNSDECKSLNSFVNNA